MVEFESYEDLKRAVAQLDNTEFRGCMVTCVADVSPSGDNVGVQRADEPRTQPVPLPGPVGREVDVMVTVILPVAVLSLLTVAVGEAIAATRPLDPVTTHRPLHVAMAAALDATTRPLVVTESALPLVAGVTLTMKVVVVAVLRPVVRCLLRSTTTRLPVPRHLMPMVMMTTFHRDVDTRTMHTALVLLWVAGASDTMNRDAIRVRRL